MALQNGQLQGVEGVGGQGFGGEGGTIVVDENCSVGYILTFHHPLWWLTWVSRRSCRHDSRSHHPVQT